MIVEVVIVIEKDFIVQYFKCAVSCNSYGIVVVNLLT